MLQIYNIYHIGSVSKMAGFYQLWMGFCGKQLMVTFRPKRMKDVKIIQGSVENSSYGLNFVKLRAKYKQFFSKNTGKIRAKFVTFKKNTSAHSSKSSFNLLTATIIHRAYWSGQVELELNMSAPVVLWLEDEAVADFDVLVYGADRQMSKNSQKCGRNTPVYTGMPV